MSTQNQTRLKKGDLIADTYEVQNYIGEGAFGEVYRVKHKFLGTQVLKLFKTEYVAKTDIDTVIREAKILSQLTHPNIVRVFEANCFHKDGQEYFYITMGFVSGESLANLLERKIQLPVPIALSIQKDFIAGLRHAHSQNPLIIHRDISPDNILLSYDDEKPRAMLSDFGLAQAMDYASHIGRAAGKFAYFAPECFWNTYLPASDVFSAGIVFYKMLTGLFPWDYSFDDVGNDQEKISTMIISARKKAPRVPSFYCDTCSKQIDQIIMKALEKDLGERYKNAEDFFDALNQLTETGEADFSNQSFDNIEMTTSGRPVKYKVNKKGIGFDQIAGMDALKETLYHDVIQPLNDKELYDLYKVSIPNGLLMYGPPGCGKTFIARKFAEEVGYNFTMITPSDVASTYIHGTQEKIARLFKGAREKAPSIIFLDEIDALMPKRENELNHGYASEVNEYLTQMTDCHKQGIFVIAATNRPDKIDSAITRTGRIDKIVYIGPPDLAARKELFTLYLKDRPIDDIDVEELAAITENYVSSDIAFLVNEASREALKGRVKISQDHFMLVMKTAQPSVSKKQLEFYEQMKNRRSFD